MIARSFETKLMLAGALTLPVSLSLGVLAVPTVMTLSSFATLVVLLLCVGAVTLNSARNARPTGSLGQMLYETEQPARGPLNGRAVATSRSRS